MNKVLSAIGWVGVLVGWVLFSETVLAGVVIEQVMTERGGRRSRVVLSISGEKLRTDDMDSYLTTILDFQEDRLVLVEHPSKSYVEMPLSEWEREVGQRLRKEIPGVTLSTRKIDVKATGEMAVINGFRTEKIQVYASGELVEEDWMTRDVDLQEIEKVMDRSARSFSKDFRIEMREGREIYEKLKAFGYPILVKDYAIAPGLGVDVLEVKRVQVTDVSNDVFLAPPGYTQISPGGPRK